MSDQKKITNAIECANLKELTILLEKEIMPDTKAVQVFFKEQQNAVIRSKSKVHTEKVMANFRIKKLDEIEELFKAYNVNMLKALVKKKK